MTEKTLAGVERYSPASIRRDIENYRKTTKAAWRPLLVSIFSPLTRERLSDGVGFVLFLGTESLSPTRNLLDSHDKPLSMLVADNGRKLEEAGFPVLDKVSGMDSGRLREWMEGKSGGSASIDDLDWSWLQLPLPGKIRRKLEYQGRSVAKTMLDLTLAVSSGQSKAGIKRTFLDWLAEPKAGASELKEALSDYMEPKDIEKRLEDIEDSDFSRTKKSCEQLVRMLRNGCDERKLDRWMDARAVSGELSSFDSGYLVSVFHS